MKRVLTHVLQRISQLSTGLPGTNQLRAHTPGHLGIESS